MRQEQQPLTYGEAKAMAQDDADYQRAEMVVVGDPLGRRNGFSITTATDAKARDLHVWSRHVPTPLTTTEAKE